MPAMALIKITGGKHLAPARFFSIDIHATKAAPAEDEYPFFNSILNDSEESCCKILRLRSGRHCLKPFFQDRIYLLKPAKQQPDARFDTPR
jgi:hypothetical protein